MSCQARRLLSRAGFSALSVAALTGALLLRPSLASACAVCFGGDDQKWASAFAAGTVMIGLLPPALVAIFGVAIYRSSQRAKLERAARQEATHEA